MSSFSNINDKRSSQWLKNALRYHFQKMTNKNRNKNLWVFSAWGGNKYADNSKYLYDYMVSSCPEITCVWQTNNQEVFDRMKEEGKPVQMLGTPEAAKTQKEAGVAVYTNGMDDFGENPNIFGAVGVFANHGWGFKKIYRSLLKKMDPLKARLSQMKWRFFNWTMRDITIVSSEYCKVIEKKMFDLTDDHTYLMTGQPRNDSFAFDSDISKAINNEDLLEKMKGKKLILYAPTWRHDTETFNGYIQSLFASEKLEQILRDHNALFLAKIHYMNRSGVESTENKIILNDDDVLDMQMLLPCIDLLITDHSSISVDFALTERPLLFYFPDWDDDTIEDIMFTEGKSAMSLNCSTTESDFFDKLEQTLKDPLMGICQSKLLNSIFETELKPGEFSKTAFEKIWKHINKV